MASSARPDFTARILKHQQPIIAASIAALVGLSWWFLLEGGTYVRQQPDGNGLLHSRTFPGLVLDVAALLRDDLAALRATVDRAVGTPEHRAFVRRLAQED